jgi:hypothetical protein
MPIDPLEGDRYALEGHLVTMDDNFRTLSRASSTWMPARLLPWRRQGRRGHRGLPRRR